MLNRWYQDQQTYPKDPCMVQVYLDLHLADLYGFHVGKYTVRPMDPSWDFFPASSSTQPTSTPQTSSLTTANIRVEAKDAKVMSFILSCQKWSRKKLGNSMVRIGLRTDVQVEVRING